MLLSIDNGVALVSRAGTAHQVQSREAGAWARASSPGPPCGHERSVSRMRRWPSSEGFNG
jgi:hypothetical protein